MTEKRCSLQFEQNLHLQLDRTGVMAGFNKSLLVIKWTKYHGEEITHFKL